MWDYYYASGTIESGNDLLLSARVYMDCQGKYHRWEEATCTTPKYCYPCDTTEGEPLGHDYGTADVCSRCGGSRDGFVYTVTDGTVSITGYTGDGDVLVIPATLGGYPVTAIQHKAFANHTYIDKVVFEAADFSVKATRVEELSGKKPTSIFSACTIGEVVFGDGVTTIPDYLFSTTVTVTEMTLPVSVTSIGMDAFLKCQPSVVHYGGTEKQWDTITVRSGNNTLLAADIRYTVCDHTFENGVCTLCGETMPSAELILGYIAGSDGETVTLPVDLQGAPALKTLALTGFEFDSRLELVSAEWAVEGVIADWDSNTQSAVITFAENTDINTTVLYLTFRIRVGAEFGAAAVTCTAIAKTMVEGEETDFPVSVIAGTVQVWIPGDVDGDAVLTSNDAIYLLYYTVLPDMYPICQPGDVNGDAMVNSDDAIYLLYHILLPEQYPLA